MKELITKILVGVLRALMAGASTWLIERGIATDAEISTLVSGLAIAIVTLGWTAWDKILASRRLHTAVALEGATTPAALRQMVKAGTFASARTAADAVPLIRNGTGDGSTV